MKIFKAIEFNDLERTMEMNPNMKLHNQRRRHNGNANNRRWNPIGLLGYHRDIV